VSVRKESIAAADFPTSALLLQRNTLIAQFKIRWELFCADNVETVTRPSGAVNSEMPSLPHFVAPVFHVGLTFHLRPKHFRF